MSDSSSKVRWLNSRLEELWGIDLRSLALFRISLALMVLLDLFNRSFSLSAHYTDLGLLSREFILDAGPNTWQWSIHLFNGTTTGQALLFVIHALFACMMLVGWRTRLATEHRPASRADAR